MKSNFSNKKNPNRQHHQFVVSEDNTTTAVTIHGHAYCVVQLVCVHNNIFIRNHQI